MSSVGMEGRTTTSADVLILLDALEDLDTRVLQVVASAGGELEEDVLSERVGMERSELRAACNRIEEAGLMGKYRGDGGGRVYETSPLYERLVEELVGKTGW